MITLSLIFDNVGVGGKKILTVIDTVVNLIFYAILIYTGFNKVFDQISTGKETFSLGWPEWVFTILAAHRLHLPGAPCDRVSGRRDEQQGRLCEAG